MLHAWDAAPEAECEAATGQFVHRRRVRRGDDRMARVVVRGTGDDLQIGRDRAHGTGDREGLLHVEALRDENAAHEELLRHEVHNLL